MAGNKEFGKHLKKLREEKGFSQDKLAELVGLEYQSISRIETGMYFTNFDNLEKIATALNVPLKELFNIQEPNYTKKELLNLINNSIKSFDTDGLERIYKIIRILEGRIKKEMN